MMRYEHVLRMAGHRERIRLKRKMLKVGRHLAKIWANVWRRAFRLLAQQPPRNHHEITEPCSWLSTVCR